MNEVTRPHEPNDGDREASDRLFPLVYDELKRFAWQRRHEHGVGTLQATVLVHEVYSKMVSDGVLDATDRSHFLTIAARAMRQVLVAQSRRRRASMRPEAWTGTAARSRSKPTAKTDQWADITLGNDDAAIDLDAAELLALDDALDKLDARPRQVVEFRLFAGVDEKEIASLLGVTDRTVRRDWVKARAWLYRALYPEQQSQGFADERYP